MQLIALNQHEIETVSGTGNYSDAALQILDGAAKGAAVGAVFGPEGPFVMSAIGAGVAASKALPVTPRFQRPSDEHMIRHAPGWRKDHPGEPLPD